VKAKLVEIVGDPQISVAFVGEPRPSRASPLRPDLMKLVESLSASDPARLSQFRREYDALVAPYFENNIVRQDYLMTRAVKV